MGIIKSSIISENDGSSRQSSISTGGDQNGWYPGKYLERLRGSSSGTRLSCDSTYDPSSPKKSPPPPPPSPPAVPDGFSEMIHAHTASGSAPKFFIAVTILGCYNLKSPLKRVITRPINSSVQVIVGDETQSTEIVSSNRNPKYLEGTFMFAIQPENAPEGFIEFIVTHKGLIDYEIIGVVRLPFVAISLSKDCQNPDYILLPLIYREPNSNSIGKGFHTFPKQSTKQQIDNPNLDGIIFHESNGIDYPANEVPSLCVRVYKVNVRQIYSEKEIQRIDIPSSETR